MAPCDYLKAMFSEIYRKPIASSGDLCDFVVKIKAGRAAEFSFVIAAPDFKIALFHKGFNVCALGPESRVGNAARPHANKARAFASAKHVEHCALPGRNETRDYRIALGDGIFHAGDNHWNIAHAARYAKGDHWLLMI